MTPESVMNSYRSRTGDDDKSEQIITDQQGIIYINDGIRAFRTDHPECQLAADGSLVTYADAVHTAMGTALILADAYFEPLVDYVCYRRWTRDAGDARDENRAAAHLAKLNAFWTGE